MKKTRLILLVLIVVLVCFQQVQAQEYQPTWNSLGKHQIPEWFKDAKFGIYTHWGVYSVPAFGQNGSWYPYNMYRKGSEAYNYHVESYGLPSEFGYKDFIPMFKGEKFDPDEWAELYQKSGAKFAGTVAEHHDGFAMWDTKYSDWNAAKMGPKRDVVGELETAIKKRGMKFILTNHHATNWHYYPHWIDSLDCSKPEYSGLYGELHDLDKDWPEWYNITPLHKQMFMQELPSREFKELWLGKLKEVIDKYQPDLIWFDGSIDRLAAENYILEFFAYYFNQEKLWGKQVEVLFKNWDFPPGVATLDLELGSESNLTRHLWITDTSVDDQGAWSYVKTAGYKSVNMLVDNLIDRVSKNGMLLLNIGPKADGSFPEEGKEALLGMGKWLEVNGEAIYGTRPWFIYGEGPTGLEGMEVTYTGADIRFTVKDSILYAICLDWPGDEVTIGSLRNMDEDLVIYWKEQDIKSIKMLGVDKELEWSLGDDGLKIKTPGQKPCKHAFAFKIERNMKL